MVNRAIIIGKFLLCGGYFIGIFLKIKRYFGGAPNPAQGAVAPSESPVCAVCNTHYFVKKCFGGGLVCRAVLLVGVATKRTPHDESCGLFPHLIHLRCRAKYSLFCMNRNFKTNTARYTLRQCNPVGATLAVALASRQSIFPCEKFL